MPDEPQAKFTPPKELKMFPNDRQLCVARFSPCGKFLAAGAMEGTVRRWSVVEKPKPAAEVELPDEPKKKPAPKNAKAPAESPVELVPLPHLTGFNGWVQNIAFHPKDKVLYAADTWGRLTATAYEGDAPKPLWENATAHDGWIRKLAISADGQHLVTGGRDQFVRVWTTAGKLVAEHRHTEDVYAVAFAPEGKVVAFGDEKGRVKTWDFGTKQIVREFDATVFHKLSRLQDVAGLRMLAFIEGGKSLVVGGCEPEGGGFLEGAPVLLKFDVATGKKQTEWKFGAAKEGFVLDLAAHPGGYLIVVTSGQPGSGKIMFLRPGDKEPFFTHTAVANVHSVTLHPDGRRFAVAAMNKASNGNGRPKTADGSYPGNTSPVHLFEIPAAM
jgi:WD40 repeat protein